MTGLKRRDFKRFPDLTKIKKHTGYKPIISLDTGLNNLLKKMKKFKNFKTKII